MALQSQTDFTNYPEETDDNTKIRESETVAQDGGRSGAMVRNTLMAYDPGNANWVPFSDETGTDGTQYPRGILKADLTEAEIQAGDVDDVPIMIKGTLDKNQLTIENSKALTTVINVPTNFNTTVEDYLRMVGIFMEDTISVNAAEA